jgi:hypothetical protein
MRSFYSVGATESKFLIPKLFDVKTLLSMSYNIPQYTAVYYQKTKDSFARIQYSLCSTICRGFIINILISGGILIIFLFDFEFIT